MNQWKMMAISVRVFQATVFVHAAHKSTGGHFLPKQLSIADRCLREESLHHFSWKHLVLHGGRWIRFEFPDFNGKRVILRFKIYQNSGVTTEIFFWGEPYLLMKLPKNPSLWREA